MTRLKYLVSISTLLATPLLLLIGLSSIVVAQEPSRIPDKKIKPLLENLSNSVNKYRDALAKGVQKTSVNQGSGEENIQQYAEDLKVAAKRLKDSYDGKRSVTADVEETLRRARPVNRFMNRNPLVTKSDNEWASVKQNLTTLTQAFNVTSRDLESDSKPTRLSDDQLTMLLDRIKSDSERFRKDLDSAIKLNRSIDKQSRENVLKTVKDFGESANRAKGKIRNDDAGTPQVKELLRVGGMIDNFMRNNQLTEQSRTKWRDLRRILNEIGRAYNVSMFELSS